MSENEHETEIEQVEEIETFAEDMADELSAPTSDGEPDNTVTFKRSHLYAVLLPLAFVAGLAFGYIFWGRDLPAETS